MTIFNSPYDPNDPLNGKECIIVERRTLLNTGRLDGSEILTIEFDDGVTLEVWAEEVQE